MSDTTRDALPPLPEPHATVDIWGHDCPHYTREQMREYARSAIAAFAHTLAQRMDIDAALKAEQAEPPVYPEVPATHVSRAVRRAIVHNRPLPPVWVAWVNKVKTQMIVKRGVA